MPGMAASQSANPWCVACVVVVTSRGVFVVVLVRCSDEVVHHMYPSTSSRLNILQLRAVHLTLATSVEKTLFLGGIKNQICVISLAAAGLRRTWGGRRGLTVPFARLLARAHLGRLLCIPQDRACKRLTLDSERRRNKAFGLRVT